MLKIENLHASIAEDGKEILKGVNLDIEPGKVHVIMGPNGSGKSTLSNIIAGRDDYEVTQGSITYQGKDLLKMAAEERAREGIFMAFQYPVEIPGLSNLYFLKSALNAKRSHQGLPEIDAIDFYELLQQRIKEVKMNDSFLKRPVNVGFSGGEKKRNEILQMSVLEPKLAMLDETDSGLDIDALKVVAEGVNDLRMPDRSFLLITHYQRLLDYIVPDVIHVMVNGKILETGDKNLALELEKNGFKKYLGSEAGMSRE